MPPERIPRLDRLFREIYDLGRRMAPRFGELTIKGDAKLAEIAQVYDLDSCDEHEKTAAACKAGHNRVIG